jgi:hypothetical protein
MKASQYRLIAEHPLRTVFRNMVTDSRDLPSVSQLRESIAAAVPGADDATKEALFEAARALAKRAATAGRDSWFDLRGEADRYVLGVVEGFEKAERLLGGDDDEDVTPEDVSGALEAIDSFDPTQKAFRAIEAHHKSAELEANRIRQMGGQ